MVRINEYCCAQKLKNHNIQQNNSSEETNKNKQKPNRRFISRLCCFCGRHSRQMDDEIGNIQHNTTIHQSK